MKRPDTLGKYELYGQSIDDDDFAFGAYCSNDIDGLLAEARTLTGFSDWAIRNTHTGEIVHQSPIDQG